MIKVITVVRAPIEQILSHYFHGLALFERHLRKQNQDVTASIISANILDCVDAYLTRQGLSVVELTHRLNESNPDRIFFHWIVLNCLNWIDEEFRPFFPCELRGGFAGKGYLIAGNALILKFEELPTNGEKAIAAYVQRPQFKLVRDNVGSDRATGGLYQQVLSTIRFPKEFVDHVCDSTYVRLLYTADERQKMKDRWAK